MYSIPRAKTVSRVVRHIDVITCLFLDRSGNFVMSGSRDTTSIIWDVYPQQSAAAAQQQVSYSVCVCLTILNIIFSCVSQY